MENKPPTLVEYYSQGIKSAGFAFAKWIETTPDDRIFWQPRAEGGSEGRSIIDQTEECVNLNQMILAGITKKNYEEPRPKFQTKEEAITKMRESSSELSGAVSHLTEHDLSKEIKIFGDHVMKVHEVLSLAFYHLAYHGGAINYIQTLYGDKEFVYPTGD